MQTYERAGLRSDRVAPNEPERIGAATAGDGVGSWVVVLLVELQLAQVLVHLDPAAKGMSVSAAGILANQGKTLGIAIAAQPWGRRCGLTAGTPVAHRSLSAVARAIELEMVRAWRGAEKGTLPSLTKRTASHLRARSREPFQRTGKSGLRASHAVRPSIWGYVQDGGARR